jgi:hypothetical protein
MKIEFEDKFQGTLVSPEALATERGSLAASLSPLTGKRSVQFPPPALS